MIMTNAQLKNYYFPNKQIENLYKKYSAHLINFYGDKTLFENKNLLPSDRLDLEFNLIYKTINLLKESDALYFDFALIYSIADKKTLAEIILESIMVYSKLNNPKYKNMDIFLDPNSVLYFNKLYPATIQRWLENKNSTILNYVSMMKDIIKLVDKLNFKPLDKN